MVVLSPRYRNLILKLYKKFSTTIINYDTTVNKKWTILWVEAIIKLITAKNIIKNENCIKKTDISARIHTKSIRYRSHYLFDY